jgi:Cu(I)/Ag(I) efflux system membrane fusion protein
MKAIAAILVLSTAVALGACKRGQPADTMPGMTAAEHARMQSGGTQGTADSTGSLTRQAVHLTSAQARALGVAYTVARREPLTRTIRTVGQIEAPEPAIVDVTPKIDGFVEHLFVSTTGEAVRRGQPLLAMYSPMLVAAQQELVTAKRLAAQVDTGDAEAWRGAQDLVQAARRRLAYWDITPAQIASIERTGEPTKTLTLVSPVTGIVLEKTVVEGQQVMPGMRLYRLADLSRVWVEGDVFEQDLQFVHTGSQAHIEMAAYPGQHVMGSVSFVYPTVDERSRTNRVRVTVANPGLRLKPGMFATMYFDAHIGSDALTVPREAVIVTGERNLVFVKGPDGMLLPRDVVLGARSESRVQILRGLVAGDTVVTAANFLVDAESRLAGEAGGMPGMAGMQHAAPPPSSGDTSAKEPRHD